MMQNIGNLTTRLHRQGNDSEAVTVLKNGIQCSHRLILAVILITALTGFSALAAAQAESGAENALTYLGRELEATAEHLVRTGEDTDDVYTEISWKSVADTFPEKFDLRTRGTVTSVKSQDPWNTCRN